MSNTPSQKNEEVAFFKAGSVIFAEGKPSQYLYLVKTGEVRLVKFNGQHLNAFAFCTEGDILNEVSVLMKKPQQFTAIAKTDVELVLIEQKDILEVIKNSPSWIPDIFQTLCDRLQSTHDMIEEHNLMAGEKDEKLIITKEEEKKYIEALAAFNAQL